MTRDLLRLFPLEPLEEDLSMAIDATWTGGNGNYADSNNWSGGVVPDQTGDLGIVTNGSLDQPHNSAINRGVYFRPYLFMGGGHRSCETARSQPGSVRVAPFGGAAGPFWGSRRPPRFDSFVFRRRCVRAYNGPETRNAAASKRCRIAGDKA